MIHVTENQVEMYQTKTQERQSDQSADGGPTQ